MRTLTKQFIFTIFEGEYTLVLLYVASVIRTATWYPSSELQKELVQCSRVYLFQVGRIVMLRMITHI